MRVREPRSYPVVEQARAVGKVDAIGNKWERRAAKMRREEWSREGDRAAQSGAVRSCQVRDDAEGAKRRDLRHSFAKTRL